ncbi:MAG: hypothetical protein JNM24_18785 [Bdellovibrionaceae bacterium]|nr:hypothetical protein [Pseudobdellovibrionaceae bacterium]
MLNTFYLSWVRFSLRLISRTINAPVVAFCALVLSLGAHGGPDVLPAGINSPMFNYGLFQNIGQRYEEDGSLWKVGDLRSVEYDASYLTKVSPDAKNLITALNAFGLSHGQSINYGVLKFDIDPSMQYFAPIYARGITKNWTLALGAPIITYQVDIHLHTVNSNLDSYKSVYMGRVSEELDRALNLDIKAETLKTIEQRGYKPLQSQKSQFMADMQIVSIYKLQQMPQFDLFYLTTVGLPTGPQYDPDDLVALNTFGLASVENTIASTFKGMYGLSATPYIGYQYVLADKITARVPLNDDDNLPDASQKENVDRQTGGKWIFKSEGEWKASDSLTFSSAYTQAQKAPDTFSGSGNARYDLLSKNTYTREETYSMKVSFNTVKAYFKKKALFPYMFYYEFSDLFKGENVNRRTLHELNFKMFF